MLSACACVQKLVLLGAVVCSRYLIVHFATDARTDDNTVQLRRNDVKTKEVQLHCDLAACKGWRYDGHAAGSES